MDHLHLIVRGRVQGVGYRFFIYREAVRLQLRGVVRNLPNRDVEIVAEGDRAALEQLLAIAREGPPRAGVSDVSAAWDEGPSRHADFRTA